MHLHSDESITKVFHHHPFPYFLRMAEILLVSIPFFFVASFFQEVLTPLVMFSIYFGIGVIFMGIIAYDFFLYFWDRITLTNKRLIYTNWINLFKRQESEVNIDDIQDIRTEEKGLLSRIPLFDYGTFRVETAASKEAVVFHEANNPEGIRNFIYQNNRKPSRIGSDIFVNSVYDRTRSQTDEEAFVSRSN